MYFALRADYSAQDKYSAPEKGADGAKHIMVCTMLVGKYTKGTKDMKVAPALPNSTQVHEWKSARCCTHLLLCSSLYVTVLLTSENAVFPIIETASQLQV